MAKANGENRIRYCLKGKGGCGYVREGNKREDCPKCGSRHYRELELRLVKIPATRRFPFESFRAKWELVGQPVSASIQLAA